MRHGAQEDFSIAEQAVEWLMRLSEDDSAASRSAFCAWFRQSPRHVEAFLEASETTRALAGLDRERRIDVEALIAEGATNVVTLSPSEPAPRSSPLAANVRPIAERNRRWKLAGAAVAVGVLVSLILVVKPASPLTLGTGVGEQRTLKLKDGSLATLNTRSRIEVSFNDQRRDVRLLEGEVLFAVAKDPARPFRVLTHDAVVRAVGTEFDVRRQARGTVVSVLEGVVHVFAGKETAGTGTGARLSAGEEAQITNQGMIRTRRLSDPEKVATWRERRLEFHDVPLTEVAAEFNRYNELHMRIEGPLEESKVISGIFDADDPQALIRFLRHDSSLTVEQAKEVVVIRQRRQ